MKTKIAIANTLKPVDDVRAFEKIAQSISKTNKYHINIIGNTGKKESNIPDIEFNIHSIAKGAFLRRFILRAQILILFFKIKPSIIIVQTHELLLVSLFHKLLRGSKIIYDVREDYKKNIQYLSPLPWVFRFPLSRFVRIKERLCSPFIDQFWLAEKCYAFEIGFPKDKSIVIENKALKSKKDRVIPKGLKCLYSGTISTYGGIHLAIDIFRKITKQIPNATLTIIGQCHDKSLIESLEKSAKKDSNIQLNISKDPVPHEGIIEQIHNSSLGLITYQPNPVNQNKIPTKLYEYSQYGLPYTIQKGTSWEQKGKELGGAIPVDFEDPKPSALAEILENPNALFHPYNQDHETWESQEEQLFKSINTLLK